MTTQQSRPGFRTAQTAVGAARSLLNVDGPRPSVAWVSSLPADWVTATQRLVLLVLACDAYEDDSAPGEDSLMRWCGLKARSTLYDALGALATPVRGLRPALIERVSLLRKRTTYRLLPSASPDTSASPDASAHVSADASADASGQTDPPYPSQPSNSSPQVPTDRPPDDDGLIRRLEAELDAAAAELGVGR